MLRKRATFDGLGQYSPQGYNPIADYTALSGGIQQLDSSPARKPIKPRKKYDPYDKDVLREKQRRIDYERWLADERAAADIAGVSAKEGLKSAAQGITDFAAGAMNRFMRTTAGVARWTGNNLLKGSMLYDILRPDMYADYMESNAKAVRDYGKFSHKYWSPDREYEKEYPLARKMAYGGGAILGALPEIATWNKFYKLWPVGNSYTKSLGGTMATMGPQAAQLTGLTYINPDDSTETRARKKAIDKTIGATGSLLNPLGYVTASLFQQPEVREQRKISYFEQGRDALPVLVSPEDVAPHMSKAISKAVGRAGDFAINNPDTAAALGFGGAAALGEAATGVSLTTRNPEAKDYANWLYGIARESPTVNKAVNNIRYGYHSPLLQLTGLQQMTHPLADRQLSAEEKEQLWGPVLKATAERYPIRNIEGAWSRIAPFLGGNSQMSPELKAVLNKHKNIWQDMHKGNRDIDPAQLKASYIFFNQLRRRLDRQAAGQLRDYKNDQTK